MHSPERMCIACRKRFPKSELIRIVKTPDGIAVDGNGKASGRGTYVCRDAECLKRLASKKMLNRVFRTEIGEDMYAEILSYSGKDR